MRKIRSYFSGLSWGIDEELSSFWTFFAVLTLGAVFYSGLLLNILDRQELARSLQSQLDILQNEQDALKQDIKELSRLNTALLPSSHTIEDGLDWETLKYLSFSRFDLIAENEGIIYFKEDDTL